MSDQNPAPRPQEPQQAGYAPTPQYAAPNQPQYRPQSGAGYGPAPQSQYAAPGYGQAQYGADGRQPYDGGYAQAPQYAAPGYGQAQTQYGATGYGQAPQYGATGGDGAQYAAPETPQYAQQGGYARPQYAGREPFDPRPIPGCDFGTAIKRYWAGYVHFGGRASRSEFWYAFLFQYLCGLGASLIPIVGPIAWGCASLVPGLAVSVRRLHDQNLSGWVYAAMYAVGCLASLPFVVGLWLLFLAGMREGESPAAGAWTVWIVVGGVLSLLYAAALIAMMCRPSDPRGERFDR